MLSPNALGLALRLRAMAYLMHASRMVTKLCLVRAWATTTSKSCAVQVGRESLFSGCWREELSLLAKYPSVAHNERGLFVEICHVKRQQLIVVVVQRVSDGWLVLVVQYKTICVALYTTAVRIN